MEPFEIKIGDDTMLVSPMEDESFHVFQGERFLAIITPDVDEETGNIRWVSAYLISKDYVRFIGTQIEAHDL